MAFKQAGGKHVSDANKESYHNAAEKAAHHDK
jgi:hypothetical protein